MNKSEIKGQMGAVPPADAPRETAQPLTAELIASQRAQAQANERELKPFLPQKAMRAPTPPPPSQPASDPLTSLVNDVFGEDSAPPAPISFVPGPALTQPHPGEVDIHGNPAPGMSAQEEVDQIEELPPLSDEDRKRMPAASDSDSPSRGLLPTITAPRGDKFEGIDRGGFGETGEAQYFPLSGDELLELSKSLIDQLVKRITNDLRFSIALTYPRVRVSAQIVVEGFVEDSDNGFVVEKVWEPKDENIGKPGGTLLSIAKDRAEEFVFVVRERRQEFTDAGDVDSPPDKIRDDLGLPKPRKMQIGTGIGRSFADIGV